MSIQAANRKLRDIAQAASPIIVGGGIQPLIGDSGLLLLNALFPDDFEYYTFGLELIDSGRNEVTDRFIFPVNPDSVSMGFMKSTSITKTAGGVTSLTNNAFTPFGIDISGTFGRSLKVLVGNQRGAGVGNALATASPNSPEIFQAGKQYTSGPFFPNIKTGYGALKALERIYNLSTPAAPSGQPYRVNFYNIAFNQVYMVDMLAFTPETNKEMNGIWQYSLNMRAIAPAASTAGLERMQSTVAATGSSAISGTLTSVLRDIQRVF